VTEALTHILLIRHAHNDYLTNHRIAGWLPGVHLSEQGRAQAQALAERLANTPLAAIYSSPLERALETAEPLAARHSLSVQVLQGIGETHCGEWTGQTVEELSKTDAWRQIQLYPSGMRFPGGESVVEIQVRMVATLESLRVAHPQQTIAIISHSDPIKTVVTHYIGLHLDLFQRLVISPASITELSFTPSGPRLLRCNDCAHIT
jgi:probable phosphoglycerate mutase